MSVLTLIPPKVRKGLYLAYTAGSPVVAYLAVKSVIGDSEVALYAGIGAALGLTAASNVDTAPEV